jgi:hypothetical protein
MNAIRWTACCAFAALLFTLVAGHAQDTVARTSGAVLILSNDRALEGEITKIGDQYRLRRGSAETLVPAERVKRLCRDWDDALVFLRAQANLGDPDERLRLARWCQYHGLREPALSEVRAAFEMRPDHVESKRLLQVLERSIPLASAPKAPPPPVAPAPASKAAQLDVSADVLATFATKVQPILLNVCAGCHTRGEGGGFQLQRIPEPGARNTNQHNLAAALAQLNLERPEASPLLIKAVSAHGQATQPPLRDRRVPPFVTLQQWVEQVAANNPQLRDPRTTAPAFNAGPATLAVAPAAVPSVGNKQGEVISRPVPRSESPLAAGEKAVLPSKSPFTPLPVSAGPPPSADPFDPEVFNRRK